MIKTELVFTTLLEFIIIKVINRFRWEDNSMDKVFKMLGFWTAMFAILFYIGDMTTMAFFFLAQTGFFVLLGYMKLTERMYMYVFAAYLVFFFVGFTYYSTFLMEPTFGNQ